MLLTHKQTIINLIDYCINYIEPEEQKVFAKTFLEYLRKDGDGERIIFSPEDLRIIQEKFVNNLK